MMALKREQWYQVLTWVIGFALCIDLVGCMRIVKSSIRGCRLAVEESADGAVHPYPESESPRSGRTAPPGPFVLVLFSTPTDLEELGNTMTVHHLYYDLFACSSTPPDADLFGGRVYKAKAEDLKGLRVQDGGSGENVYKVYVPSNLHWMGQVSDGNHGISAAKEIQKVRQDGLCILIGAGNKHMFAGGFRSERMKLPVEAVGDYLQINQVSERQGVGQ